MREFVEDGPPDLSNLGDIRPNPPPPISLDDTAPPSRRTTAPSTTASRVSPGYPWLRS